MTPLALVQAVLHLGVSSGEDGTLSFEPFRRHVVRKGFELDFLGHSDDGKAPGQKSQSSLVVLM